MLLTCPSCNSKYLVNSADLKPNGRTVRCAKCIYEWFQDPDLVKEDNKISSSKTSFVNEQGVNREAMSITSNLPATYVQEVKPSIINSFLTVLILIISVYLIWIIKNEGAGIIVLLNFYIQEFYFNLKLIINDLAKITHQIIN